VVAWYHIPTLVPDVQHLYIQCLHLVTPAYGTAASYAKLLTRPSSVIHLPKPSSQPEHVERKDR
jgi:hypothetical protein